MLPTDLYTVASGPVPSGELSVPDPSPADAERAIAENVVPAEQGLSQLNEVFVSQLDYHIPIDGNVREHTTCYGEGLVWDSKTGQRRGMTHEELKASWEAKQEKKAAAQNDVSSPPALPRIYQAIGG